MRPNRESASRPDGTGCTDRTAPRGIADRIGQVDRLLPQTQCRRCGFEGCLPYAEAIVEGSAPINRCPPGGEATIAALAQQQDTEVLALDPACGATQPRRVARIDNDTCIGCTKCIVACPVDAIVGAPKHQHHVLADRCTGCDLCLAPCPADCITMTPVSQDWSDADANRGRRHHRAKLARLGPMAGASVEPAGPDAAAGGTAAAPVGRDPLLTLSAPAEKARRLAAILSRARGAASR